MKRTEKQIETGKYYLARYNASAARELSDVYKTYSSAKAAAMRYCKDKAAAAGIPAAFFYAFSAVPGSAAGTRAGPAVLSAAGSAAGTRPADVFPAFRNCQSYPCRIRGHFHFFRVLYNLLLHRYHLTVIIYA